MSSYSAVKSEPCCKFEDGCQFDTGSDTQLSSHVTGQQWYLTAEAKAKEGEEGKVEYVLEKLKNKKIIEMIKGL